MMSDLALSPHPSVEKLRTFGLGQLDASEASAVEEHVSRCEACCRTLAEVRPDTLIDLLRDPPKLLDPVYETGTVALSHFSSEAGADLSLPCEEPGVAGLPPELANHPRYRVLAVLGSGGMGAVYKAEHRLMERLVALKVMRTSLLGSPAMVERFRREAKAAARLAHPHIVTAHDAEQAGELHLLVMEYVEGTDLARLVAERSPLPIGEACDYVRQAAAGLQHAHEHGMIHRDIKPHNLMLTPQGVVKILDFGLARLSGDAGSQIGSTTSQGTVLGTVDYMAPEQADDAHQADIRSDIYSLGCTLYYLLSGRPPFPQGTLVQKIMAHTERQPTPLRDLRPDLPPGLARMVERMMAKAPGQRYQTPAEVGLALEPFAEAAVAILAEAPAAPSLRLRPRSGVSGRTEEVAKRQRPPRRPEVILNALLVETPPRRRRLALGLAALLLAGLVAAAAAVYRIKTDNGELVISTDNPDVEVVIKQNGQIVRVIDTKTGKEIKLDSGLYELELGGKAEGLKLSLDKVTIHRGETVVATIERRPKAVAAEKGDEVRRFEGHGGPVRAVAISPDGRYALSASGFPEGDKTIRLWDVATGKEIRRFEGHTNQVLSVAFSPDGRTALSSSEDRTMRLWDVATGKEIRRFEGPDFSVAFSPDGRRALSGSGDRILQLWDLETGKEVRRFEGHEGWVVAVAFSPDGRRAASTSGDGTVRLWEVETGEQLRSYRGTPGGISCSVAWSPDGRHVVFGDGEKSVLWDVETGKVARELGAGASGVAFSPDGRRVLSGGRDKVLRLWDVETGKELQRFTGHLDIIWSVAISADGRYALSGSGGQYRDEQWRPGRDWTIRLWRLPAPPEKISKVRQSAAANSPPPAKPEVLHAIPWQDESQGFPAHIYQTGISSDGRLFFGAGDAGFSGAVRVFDLATGKQVQELVLGEDTGGQVAFTFAQFVPGGKQIVVSYTNLKKELYLWDIATGKLVRKFEGHTETGASFAVAPDGKRLLSWSDDKTLRLWDVETGKELRKLEGHTEKAAGLFAPDGKHILTFSEDKTLRLWDVDSGKELKKLEGHTDACTGCFSPDGKQALSYGPDQTIRLWDLGTGKEVRRFAGPTDKVLFAGFVAGGRRIVGRTEDQKFRIWETDSGKLIAEIDGSKYGGDGWSLAATPDGRQALVSVEGDSSVRLLDLPSGKETHSFESCPKARFWSFTPDGTVAVAGSFRAGMFVFRLPAPPKE